MFSFESNNNNNREKFNRLVGRLVLFPLFIICSFHSNPSRHLTKIKCLFITLLTCVCLHRAGEIVHKHLPNARHSNEIVLFDYLKRHSPARSLVCTHTQMRSIRICNTFVRMTLNIYFTPHSSVIIFHFPNIKLCLFV